MKKSVVMMTLLLSSSLVAHAQSRPETPADQFLVERTASDIQWLPANPTLSYELQIQSPDGTITTQHFGPGEVPEWRLIPGTKGAMNGLYTYQILSSLETPMSRNGMTKSSQLSLTEKSGYFTVSGGGIVDPDVPEQGLTKDIVHADDVIINGGSLCVGFDCVNNESFGFDTLRLKENNLRIDFNDTSTSSSFPTRDWRITANDSANGGANYLGIEDVDAGTVPFRVLAGAGNNALYVNSKGDVGLGTSTPALELQISDGDTPGIRLEQTGFNGYAPQTWDVAGNEANFFVRDVTGGSKLPFRIRPGAPTSSIDISASGNVGMGTQSPSAALHVVRSSDAQVLVENTTTTPGQRVTLQLKNAGKNRFSIVNTDAGENWTFDNTGVSFDISRVGTGVVEFRVLNNGDVRMDQGQAYAQSFNTVSSRTAKTDFSPVDSKTVLKKVAALGVSEWRYKTAPQSERHIGPMAEDFETAFGLGNGKHINLVDFAGVSLAAIKGLQEENEAKQARIDELEARVDRLEKLVEASR